MLSQALQRNQLSQGLEKCGAGASFQTGSCANGHLARLGACAFRPGRRDRSITPSKHHAKLALSFFAQKEGIKEQK